MKPFFMREGRGWDSVWLAMLLLGMFLVGLLAYFIHVDGRSQHFKNIRTHIQKMEMLNQKIETLPYQTYRYIDHDTTRRIFKDFAEHMDTLLRISSTVKGREEEMHRRLEALEKEFKRKEDLALRFEALNANITNSVHVLFDLKKNILKRERLSVTDREALDQLYFIFLQALMDMPLDQKERYKWLEQISDDLQKSVFFPPLYQHMEHFYQNREKIIQVTREYQQVKLYEKIYDLSTLMQQYEKRIRRDQKGIGITFFLIAFGILFLLGLLYRNQQTKHKELLAFRSAVENSDNSIMLTDADRHIEYVNSAFEEQTGYGLDEVRGENPSILKSEMVSPEVYRELNATLDQGEKWIGELVNRRKDGSLVYEKASIVPIFMDNELIQYLAIKLDVTDYIQQQKVLEQSAIVYDNMADAVLITDANRKIISCNSAFNRMFGYSLEELTGEMPTLIMTEAEEDIFYQRMWRQLQQEGKWSGRIKNRKKDGSVIPVWLTIGVVRNTDGEIENYIAIYTDLQEIIMMEEQIHYLAYHDGLTGLPNRVEFTRRISDIVKNRTHAGAKFAIFFIDLDRFKVINDTLGHHIGDRILVELSRRVNEILSHKGTLFRIGGDEFVVMFPMEEDETEVAQWAEKLLRTTRQPMRIDNYHLSTSASIGIAIYPEHGTSEVDLMKHADAAMYHAKEAGQDTYCFYTDTLSEKVQLRLSLEQELQYAIERGEFDLHFQPQYQLESRKIVGVEALLRWENHKLGTMMPDVFIPIAEEMGLIIDIGYYVFEEACKAFMRWQEQGIVLDFISINISSMQFREEDLFDRFSEIMDRYAMPPTSVELEITERFLLEYSDKSMAILERFRDLGCRIAIDDFGTGYSSMSYLRKLPLDTIKIDRSFLKDVPDESADTKVIKAVIALSRSLGYDVVAEGIETEVQERFLRSERCDRGQGYLFAYPMEEEDLVAFCHRRKDEEDH